MSKRSMTMFERRGILTRNEKLSLLVGSPILLALLLVEVRRVWRAFQGEPLLITGLFDPDVVVQWSSAPTLFILGMVFHAVLILFLSGALWLQAEQARRWLRGTPK